MARADLLALTPAGLTQISNAGLVKRSQRDLDSGQVPELNETDDGAIEARFADGTLTKLAAGRIPADATCSCPASSMCRHRIMLVLAYQRLHVTQERAESWDPAGLDLAAYEIALAPSARADLSRLLSASLPITLERGPVPAARLPMATVRFLAPNNLAYARCDCAQTSGCAHVALALRAFRAARGAAETTLGAATPVKAADELVAAVDAALAQLLREGVIAGMAAHAARLDHARNAASAHGATWLVLAIEALIDQIEAYERRSARYDELTALALAAELYARTRSANSVAALGIGEAMETTMAKTRLVSLGVRISTRGNELAASALLADSDTGTALLLENRFFTGKDGDPLSAESISDRLLAPGVSVRAAGRGQILTSVAKRRADGLLVLGQGGGGKTVLLPQATVPPLPAPLGIDNLSELIATFEDRPPALIAPRNRVLDVHVFTIESVVGQAFVSGAQVWRAAVTLPNGGGTLHLERRYDAGAPSALPTLFAAVDGRYGTIRQIAGTVHRDAGGIVCEPWSLVADRLIVPDLEQTDGGTNVAIVEESNESNTPAESARRFLAGSLHAGLRQRDSQFDERGRKMLTSLRHAGFEQTAQRVATWLAAPAEEVLAFGQAAVWLDALLAG